MVSVSVRALLYFWQIGWFWGKKHETPTVERELSENPQHLDRVLGARYARANYHISPLDPCTRYANRYAFCNRQHNNLTTTADAHGTGFLSPPRPSAKILSLAAKPPRPPSILSRGMSAFDGMLSSSSRQGSGSSRMSAQGEESLEPMQTVFR